MNIATKNHTLGELLGDPLDDRSAGLNGCDPAPKASPAAPTLADFIVRAARGRETKNGVAFSGMLWKGDEQVAEFRNAGNGGCNVWNVRNLKLFAEFEAIAKARLPDEKFEQSDTVVGELWDAAFTRDAMKGGK